VELALAVCEKLGWTLKMQPIEKENVYIELSSGNIDVAWGGVALSEKEIAEKTFTICGPYIHNQIVVATRNGSSVWNKLRLGGRKMCMPSTPEAREALDTDPRLIKRLGQITRLAGGTTECFEYLYAGKCDVVLTDSTAVDYFNCH
jgi:polar amino acid transport system substrate-binding protein